MINVGNVAGNYIYKNNALQFFNAAEGYFNVTSTSGNVSGDYVYQYKDHLGSIRLSYSDINNNGSISASTEIIEENNYYPFGLKHKGYNNVISSNGNSVGQKEKTFQGQRYTDDLGLNVHEWKYRVSDPAIGRFWQVDPLAEDYVHNGTYNFSENRVIDAVELEGLEAYRIDEFYSNNISKKASDTKKTEKPKAKDKSLRIMSAMMAKRTGGNADYFFNAMKDDNYVTNRIGDNIDAMTMFPISDAYGSLIKTSIKNSIKKGVKSFAKKTVDDINLAPLYDGADDLLGVSVKNGGKSDFLGSIGTSELGSVMEMNIIVPEGMRNQGILSAVVQKGVDKFNPLVIKGEWLKSFNGGNSVNYSSYMKNLKTMSPAEAALNTPTGRAAQKAGYGNALVTRNANEVVTVEFTKN